MTTVIYHSADFDGIFCREIAKHFLGEKDVNYIGWNYGDLPVSRDLITGRVIIMDLPVDQTNGVKFPNDLTKTLDSTGKFYGCESLTWIDHHKSSIETHPTDIPGYRIDGVAACRLAWQWFRKEIEMAKPENLAKYWPLPTKDEYLNRSLPEPLAVRLAGEYDIWDHRGDGDLEFQFGLRSEKELKWQWLLDTKSAGCDSYALQLVAQGKLIMEYSKGVDAGVVNHRSFITEFEGLKFLTLNTARCNSLTFAAKDVPETGHDGLLAFFWSGKEWNVSMYHASHRKDLDLSEIAKKHGGGGHRGACGFRTTSLPFLPK